MLPLNMLPHLLHPCWRRSFLEYPDSSRACLQHSSVLSFHLIFFRWVNSPQSSHHSGHTSLTESTTLFGTALCVHVSSTRKLFIFMFLVIGILLLLLVTQLCQTLWDPMDCSMLGFPVLHYLPEFAQIQVHCVNDAIQPSHPLSLPSPPVLNLSEHQSLSQWVSSSHSFQFSYSVVSDSW